MRKNTMIFTLLLIVFLAGCTEVSKPDMANPNILSERRPIDTDEQQSSESEQTPSYDIGIEDEVQPEVKTDTGTYQGQIDSNFIEINISGVPKEKAMKVFMLSDELKGTFGDMELGPGEVIRFWYFVNENKQNVIITIEKTNRGDKNE